MSGSPLARFSGKTQQNIKAAAPAPAKKSSGRRKAARDHSDAGRVSKKPWNDGEDMKILELVQIHGAKSCPLIAEHLPGRVGKQCRERWFNHLDPDIKKGDWTPDEDAVLFETQRVRGRAAE